MQFFIDRNIPERLARMLDHYDREHSVVFHDDWFEKTTPDTEWLTSIASRPEIPVVVSGDGRILRNPAELQVLAGLPLTFFLFVNAWNNLPWSERAWKSIKVWPSIVSAASPQKPTVFRVPISASKVEFEAYTNDLGSGPKRNR